ncbi:late competence protein ComER [Paenibacillus koleovorans]|uniref:late competence protein ComER n=1 Tax=Paenibacillus koleovorans TaxID=121608 RepID=UPI000FD70291|nr:late competence protein ComER [Paenibacillus koleovorans]
MKVGFIGTGSMGSILIESWIHAGALQPSDIVASNRTFGKAEAIADRHPGLRAVRTNLEVADKCELIFLCVKPAEYKKVLDEIKNVVHPAQIIVSITSPVMIKHLEHLLNCKIVKIIPSITNYVLSGALLCIYGKSVDCDDKERLMRLFSTISTPVEVSEDHTRICSDLSSCGPAFVAFFLQRLIDAAVEETGIPREEATRLTSEMLLGTGKLLTEGGFTPETLRERVSVPGGITAAGLQLMATELDGMFNRLIGITHAKYHEDVEKVENLFYGKIME